VYLGLFVFTLQKVRCCRAFGQRLQLASFENKYFTKGSVAVRFFSGAMGPLIVTDLLLSAL